MEGREPGEETGDEQGKVTGGGKESTGRRGKSDVGL